MKLSPHFQESEFLCRCCGESIIDARLVMALEELRVAIDAPLTISSGYRCKKRNKAVGGEANSQHMMGKAADISFYPYSGLSALYIQAQDVAGFHGIGFDGERGYIHVDVRSGPRVEWTYKNGKAVRG